MELICMDYTRQTILNVNNNLNNLKVDKLSDWEIIDIFKSMFTHIEEKEEREEETKEETISHKEAKASFEN